MKNRSTDIKKECKRVARIYMTNLDYVAFETKCSGTSNFEHNPFQETVRHSIYSTFELNFPILINPFQTPKIYSI
jgi:hypothetical protein